MGLKLKQWVFLAKVRYSKSLQSSKASFSGDVMLETFVQTAKTFYEIDPGLKI